MSHTPLGKVTCFFFFNNFVIYMPHLSKTVNYISKRGMQVNIRWINHRKELLKGDWKERYGLGMGTRYNPKWLKFFQVTDKSEPYRALNAKNSGPDVLARTRERKHALTLFRGIWTRIPQRWIFQGEGERACNLCKHLLPWTNPF